ncbi:MAG: DEAD/DEAH box helicase family protein [Actinomycetota bacterium]|nr:DEAD/DEAH box helicase family protein [Actinomycetota bacterium]
MPDVIENPVINSPYEEPRKHFVFGNDGITNEIGDGRRESTFFIPIAPPRRKEAQLQLEGVMTAERMRSNELINKIRVEVGLWRQGGYRGGITPTTRKLLEHWTDSTRETRLFFCQVEAAETAIFLGEVASRSGVHWIENELQRLNGEHNGGLFRMAVKIATGGGKTLVMAMLIAWQALNKAANRQDRRFADRFLVVTPGITVRDRLRVLKPNDPENAYVDKDLVPADMLPALQHATIELTNYHAFLRREKVDAAKLTKQILSRGVPDAFKETPEEMVNRVCRAFGNKKAGIVVINDEAHHCYYRKREPEVEEKLSADEKKEVEERARAAEAWITGLEAIRAKLGVKVVYDLSATPFFLKGSGYIEGTLFPWVVSDFALIDAIEAGIVKVPRVPVVDNRGGEELPTYRNIWVKVRDKLPKGTRVATEESGEWVPPDDLASALQTLYEDYERSCAEWDGIATPPVFIVVCNNTRVSKRVYDYVAGWERTLPDGQTVLVGGRLPLFSNVDEGQQWKARPASLLVDSVELESGEMSPEFRKAAAVELGEFKQDYRIRSGGHDPEQITDEELLREVLNTVGKPGKLGAEVRCVVSVSMLAEGWDATTVTHILGVRAFGTQLLCEQVVGRALRRYSYVPNEQGMFDPEYAEVYGVPFAFVPVAPPKSATKKIAVIPNHVATVPERSELMIRYPRIQGYRYDIPAERIEARFTDAHRMTLTSKDIITWVECDPIVGLKDVHTFEHLRDTRMQAVAFGLARRLLENHFRDEEQRPKVWLYPQLVAICKRWLAECLTCSSETYPQLVLMHDQCARAAGRIHQAIVQTVGGETLIKPIMAEDNPIGSTDNIAFDTVKPVVDVTKSHLNRMVIDSGWEEKVGQVLEQMPEVLAWVKNDRIGPDRKGLRIPYTDHGKQVEYVPDFIARIDGAGEPAWHMLIEVTGERREKKLAKAGTALNLWLPAVNHWGKLGRWGYIEIHDPWMAQDEIWQLIRERKGATVGA